MQKLKWAKGFFLNFFSYHQIFIPDGQRPGSFISGRGTPHLLKIVEVGRRKREYYGKGLWGDKSFQGSLHPVTDPYGGYKGINSVQSLSHVQLFVTP